MRRFVITLSVALAILMFSHTSVIEAQQKRKVVPNINESTEYKNVFHSPSAKSTPPVFRSVFQMEIIVSKTGKDAKIQYANGVLVANPGVLATVLDLPNSVDAKNGGIEEATVLQLNGSGLAARLISYDKEHGVALFRAKGLPSNALRISKAPMVTGRRLVWSAVFRDGRKTFLYTRPLELNKGKHSVGGTDDLCEVIDRGSSSLNADRTGSALVGLDGSLVALMGFQPHWTVTGRNTPSYQKVSWAVPGSVIKKLVSEIE